MVAKSGSPNIGLERLVTKDLTDGICRCLGILT